MCVKARDSITAGLQAFWITPPPPQHTHTHTHTLHTKWFHCLLHALVCGRAVLTPNPNCGAQSVPPLTSLGSRSRADSWVPVLTCGQMLISARVFSETARRRWPVLESTSARTHRGPAQLRRPSSKSGEGLLAPLKHPPAKLPHLNGKEDEEHATRTAQLTCEWAPAPPRPPRTVGPASPVCTSAAFIQNSALF